MRPTRYTFAMKLNDSNDELISILCFPLFLPVTTSDGEGPSNFDGQ